MSTVKNFFSNTHTRHTRTHTRQKEQPLSDKRDGIIVWACGDVTEMSTVAVGEVGCRVDVANGACDCAEKWRARNGETVWCDGAVAHTHGDWQYSALVDIKGGSWVRMDDSYSVDKLFAFLGEWDAKKDGIGARVTARAARTSWTRAQPRERCNEMSLLVALACGRCGASYRSLLLDDTRLESAPELPKNDPRMCRCARRLVTHSFVAATVGFGRQGDECRHADAPSD